jgi:hypothetical protein
MAQLQKKKKQSGSTMTVKNKRSINTWEKLWHRKPKKASKARLFRGMRHM